MTQLKQYLAFAVFMAVALAGLVLILDNYHANNQTQGAINSQGVYHAR